MGQSVERVRIYVALAGEDRILIGTIDSRTGAVDFHHDVGAQGGPEMMAVDPSGRFLVAGCHPRHYSSEVTPGDARMHSYRIDQDSGRLAQINSISMASAPTYLSFDRKGHFVLSAHYRMGKAAVHRIDPEGYLGEATQWFESGGGAHCIQVDASNRYAFLAHISLSKWNQDTWLPQLSPQHALPSGSNTILQFRFDDETGRLTPNAPFRLPGERGGGPRHYCFHPTQDVVYFSNEQGCAVTAYRLDAITGTLTPIQCISTLPTDESGPYDDHANCSSLRIARSGRHLYVLNRGRNSNIACYSVAPDSGELRLTGHVPTEAYPRELELDPQDRFMFVVGYQEGRMASYKVLDDGSLAQLDSRPVGRRPMWISITASG